MDTKIIDKLKYMSSEIRGKSLDSYLVNVQESRAFPDIKYKCNFLPFEKHRYYEIAIQLSGTSVVEVESQYFVLKKDNIIIIDKNISHRLGTVDLPDEPCIMCWLAASNETIRPGVSEYQNGKRQKKWAMDINAPGSFLIAEIIDELKLKHVSSQVISQYLSTFLLMVSRKISFSGISRMVDRKGEIIRKIKEYIEQNIRSRITLIELSRYISVSPNYLCALFKKMENETIQNYIQDTRIKSSVPMLLDTRYMLSEVAETFGFCDQFHYSKTFKKYMGMSPAQYRATYRTKNIEL